ncbi:MAG: zeta toxin family protein [Verrucomicrobiota bacterium]
MDETPPVLIALAGSNGAGKTTFYRQLLSDKGLPFVNADVLADEMKLGPYEAASIADDIRRLKFERRESFIMETVFSDPVGAKIQFLKEASEVGFAVTLFFIGLESPGLSAMRVGARVKAGGHDVPTEKLMARYERTLANLKRAILLLPRIIVYDNSSYESPYRLLGEFKNGRWFPKADAPKVNWFSSIC